MAGGAGGDEIPFSLKVLEEEHEREVAEGMAKLAAKYHTALEKLRAEYTAAGDLDSLLAVRAELARISAERRSPAPPTEPGDPPATGSYKLAPAGATLTGRVSLDGELGLLVGWKGAGSAEWALAKVAPGDYLVTLDYHSGPFAGGKVAIDIGGDGRQFEITGSGMWDDPKSVEIGTFTVTAEPDRSLRLTLVEARTQGVMELRQVRLTPAGKQPPGGGG